MARDSKPGLEPAPGDLRIVQEFVNTTMRGTERLTSPKVLSGYLARWKLLSRGTELGEEHLGRALEVREALRSLVLAHNDRTPIDAQAVECLNQIAATARAGTCPSCRPPRNEGPAVRERQRPFSVGADEPLATSAPWVRR